MARGKVQLRRIENPVHRQVTFCKRRAGLLKKARELSVLCDADIGIIIFSAHGKLYDLATTGTMDGLIERYKSASGEGMTGDGCGDQRVDPKQEAMVLKQEIDLLQKGLRYIYGNRANEHMNVDELNALERYLEIWMFNIRSAKMQIMIQEIQALKSKASQLVTVQIYKYPNIIDNLLKVELDSLYAGGHVESCQRNSPGKDSRTAWTDRRRHDYSRSAEWAF
ncbi:hypothetical protein VPH35_137871 [Triticum aestivum]